MAKKTTRVNFSPALVGDQSRRQKDRAALRHKLTAQKLVMKGMKKKK